LEALGKGIAGVSIPVLWPVLPAEFLLVKYVPAHFSTRQRGREGERTSPISPPLSTGCGPCLPGRSAAADPINCGPKWSSFRHFHEAIMNEDVLNVSVRKFLKKVGITSQREIEQAVRGAVSASRLKGDEALPAKMVLTIDSLGLSVEIEGAIELE
jgi:Family of unknown function (DUF6494)